MNIILLEKVAGLGELGDRVDVRAGYARNFLIPQRKATEATKANIERFEAPKQATKANCSALSVPRTSLMLLCNKG